MPVRRPHVLTHLISAIRAAGDRDVVAMTVRVIGVDVPDDPTQDPRATEHERQLFSAVMAAAEREGRAVRLMIVPGVNVFDAIIETALRLKSAEIHTGESETLSADDQARLLGEAWERASKPSGVDVRLVVYHPRGTHGRVSPGRARARAPPRRLRTGPPALARRRPRRWFKRAPPRCGAHSVDAYGTRIEWPQPRCHAGARARDGAAGRRDRRHHPRARFRPAPRRPAQPARQRRRRGARQPLARPARPGLPHPAPEHRRRNLRVLVDRRAERAPARDGVRRGRGAPERHGARRSHGAARRAPGRSDAPAAHAAHARRARGSGPAARLPGGLDRPPDDAALRAA